MNGAQALIQTLINGDVDTCFTNPGTSEMHFVAALDQVDGMRAVLGLFEGVCTGAADGYGRMRGKPACTLLHLGPGLGNGIANLHNARRAQTPIVNIIGEHATYHIQHDAPLTSDIEGLATTVSGWTRTSLSPDAISGDTADAIQAASKSPGCIATLILPGDTSWNELTVAELAAITPPPAPTIDFSAVRQVAEIIRTGEPTLLLLTDSAVLDEAARWAGRIAAATGVGLMSNRPTARLQSGGGRPVIDALHYPVPISLSQLEKYQHIVLVGTAEPVAFFAYPNSPSRLAPEGCQIHVLAEKDADLGGTLAALGMELGVSSADPLKTHQHTPPTLPQGKLTIDAIWQSVAAQMPEQAIIVNEAITSGFGASRWLNNAAPFDMLTSTGGAIGHGLAQQIGAGIACPDRQIIGMQADGSAMYTIQALWTQARENLNCVTVLFNNRAYRILQLELQNVGAKRSGDKADSILHLDNPQLDFVSLAQGMGVEASRADSAETFNDQFAAALAKSGPHLIEVLI